MEDDVDSHWTYVFVKLSEDVLITLTKFVIVGGGDGQHWDLVRPQEFPIDSIEDDSLCMRNKV